jgi:basic membrane protein A and related proteins
MRSQAPWRAVVLAAVALLALTACGGGNQAPGGGGQPKLRIAYVTPNPIGQNQFLTLGQQGIDRVGKQLGAETRTVESTNPTEREENVRAMARDGWDIVVVLSFDFVDIITQAAEEFPNTKFVIIDACVDKPNVYCGTFREHEAAFLVGAVAGSLTRTNVVGTVAAMDTPFIRRWPEGFAQGARYVKPGVDVKTLFVGSFTDPAKSKELALTMSAQHADQIFAAAAAGNPGVFEAAKEKNFSTYGVDINECPKDPQHIVENLIKRVDVAVFETVRAAAGGSQQRQLTYGLKENGVGLTVLTLPNPEQSQCAIRQHPQFIQRVKDLRQRILDGTITVKDPLTS